MKKSSTQKSCWLSLKVGANKYWYLLRLSTVSAIRLNYEINQKDTIDLNHYGKVLLSGNGEKPTKNDIAIAKKYGWISE